MKENPGSEENSKFHISCRWSLSIECQHSESWEKFFWNRDKKSLFQPNLRDLGSSDLGLVIEIHLCAQTQPKRFRCCLNSLQEALEKGFFFPLYWDFCAGYSPGVSVCPFGSPGEIVQPAGCSRKAGMDKKAAGIQLEFSMLCFLTLSSHVPPVIKTKQLKNPSTFQFRNNISWIYPGREGLGLGESGRGGFPSLPKEFGITRGILLVPEPAGC